MGYTTKFNGSLMFKNEPTVPQLKELGKYLGEEVPSGYCQFELTPGMDGIKWDGSEKFYGAVECVNHLTEKMREQWPDFAFIGELQAQGEEMDDRWRLVMNANGVAEKVDVALDGIKCRCPHCRWEFRVDEKGKLID